MTVGLHSRILALRVAAGRIPSRKGLFARLTVDRCVIDRLTGEPRHVAKSQVDEIGGHEDGLITEPTGAWFSLLGQS